uniref:Uncharacterized protein n=1 Tax=Heliothis virescens TaxID=7102 RepID=A0A2A4K7W2_HELVI
MARPKKTKEEILARRRIAKRKRYAALKQNEELYNIEKEKEKARYLKRKSENKLINEAVVHLDFSENYALKHHTEIQSFHFGGSRKEVSIHTVVIYIKDFETFELKTYSVCTVSDNLKHTAVAIWAHLGPILSQIAEISPFIDTLHFYSDSPSSQYRNRNMFYVLTQLEKQFIALRKLSWNYMEVGHGKGAPDGLGAVVKRTADRIVNTGTDIGTFSKFVEITRANLPNVKIVEVTNSDIDEKQAIMPNCIPSFKGTMAVHQVIWRCGSERHRLEMRSRSCFRCQEEVCQHYHLGIHSFEKVETNQVYKEPTLEDNALPIAAPALNTISEIYAVPQQSGRYSPELIQNVYPSKRRRKLHSNNIIKQEGPARDIIIFSAMPQKASTSKEFKSPEKMHTLSTLRKFGDWQNSTFVGTESRSYCDKFKEFLSDFDECEKDPEDIEKRENKENILKNQHPEKGEGDKGYKGKGVGKKTRKDNAAGIEIKY